MVRPAIRRNGRPDRRQLVAAFGPRVTFTRFVAPESPRGAWAEYYDAVAVRAAPPEPEIYELVDDLAPVAGPTLDATTFGKWDARNWPPGSVTAGGCSSPGVSTDCCVLSTALAAADAGVEVRVVADACAGVSDADHRRALDVMRLYGPLIQVVHVSDLERAAGRSDESGVAAG